MKVPRTCFDTKTEMQAALGGKWQRSRRHDRLTLFRGQLHGFTNQDGAVVWVRWLDFGPCRKPKGKVLA